jgi:NAD(P)-dependent dehydrogenase (short-subunit alcohol dehydrogenase family)
MKTILITGANGNLGLAVTKYFLDKGYKVIATVHNLADKNEDLVHTNLMLEKIDLTNESETAAFVQSTIQAHGPIEAALLLVGGFTAGNIFETKSQDIKKQISLNFDTAYHVLRPMFAHMLEKNNGRIVLIGSKPALNAASGKKLLAYGLAKSLLFKVAEYLNAEAKGKNVVTTVVAPGTIDTKSNRAAMPDANFDDWVKPQTLAEIFDFVISEKAAELRETVLKVYNNS